MVGYGTGHPKGQLWLNLTSAREDSWLKLLAFRLRKSKRAARLNPVVLLPVWVLNTRRAGSRAPAQQQSPACLQTPGEKQGAWSQDKL